MAEPPRREAVGVEERACRGRGERADAPKQATVASQEEPSAPTIDRSQADEDLAGGVGQRLWSRLRPTSPGCVEGLCSRGWHEPVLVGTGRCRLAEDQAPTKEPLPPGASTDAINAIGHLATPVCFRSVIRRGRVNRGRAVNKVRCGPRAAPKWYDYARCRSGQQTRISKARTRGAIGPTASPSPDNGASALAQDTLGNSRRVTQKTERGGRSRGAGRAVVDIHTVKTSNSSSTTRCDRVPSPTPPSARRVGPFSTLADRPPRRPGARALPAGAKDERTVQSCRRKQRVARGSRTSSGRDGIWPPSDVVEGGELPRRGDRSSRRFAPVGWRRASPRATWSSSPTRG